MAGNGSMLIVNQQVVKMELEVFNLLPGDQAEKVVRPCVDIDRWVASILAGRPYSSVADVVTTARTAAPGWTVEEIDEALAHHPRIGDRAQGQSAEATMSRTEQSALGNASEDLNSMLAAGNREYEKRFSRVFLIRAAGRSASEILGALRLRLQNTPEAELGVVAEQLREIAVLRLKGLLEP